ncbi:Hpt domain-containing protein [Neptuniibacter sp.]|uniref:Hpt domain-containing protein n=1 Tax=Neptuniibacter sp. TaxID=1962643 RepID=UPI00262FB2DD|nr:Hpt domain-containing protein [Neptuniibacter sp.]MCP4595859.1 hypothetical protein [Neptuniibacter sp.]
MSQDNYNAFQSLSDELKTEFYTSFREAMDELDICFSTLNCSYQEDVVHEMFRAVHSLKGNCHMVFLDDIADICHRLEDLVSQMRKGEYTYTPPCGEFMTYIFQRLEQLVASAIAGNEIAENNILVLQTSVDQVFKTEPDKREDVILKTLDSLSGALTATEDVSEKILERLEKQEKLKNFSDLEFMQRISDIMRSKSLQHQCKVDRLLGICTYINKHLTNKVSDDQISAALYMNLLGSKFVTSPIFEILPDSDCWEKQRVSEQLELTAGFLKLGGKWLSAAEMIEHSFARYDGKGVPEGLAGEEINPGGMILALVRYYQQQYRKARVEHNAKIAVAKVLRSMNSEKGLRFNPDYVDIFNQLVREDLESVYI